MNGLLRAIIAATLATAGVSLLVAIILKLPALGGLAYLALMVPLIFVSSTGIDVGRFENGFLVINAQGYLLWVALLWIVSFLIAISLKRTWEDR